MTLPYLPPANTVLSSSGCLDERGCNEFPDPIPLGAAGQDGVEPSLLMKIGR